MNCILVKLICINNFNNLTKYLKKYNIIYMSYYNLIKQLKFSAVSGQRSAVSGQRSAVSGQRSAVSGQTRYARSAFSRDFIKSIFQFFHYLKCIFLKESNFNFGNRDLYLNIYCLKYYVPPPPKK